MRSFCILLFCLALTLTAGAASAAAAEKDIAKLNEEGLELFKNGEHRKGIFRLEQALEAAEEAYGTNHQTTDVVAKNLARLYRGAGHKDQARPLYERLIDHYSERHGDEDPRVGVLFYELGMLHAIGTDARVEAFEEAVDILEDAEFPSPHGVGRTYVRTLYSLAHAKIAVQDMTGVRHLYLRAQDISEERFGTEAAITGETHYAMGQFRLSMRDYDEAEEELVTALDIWANTLPKTHPNVLTAHASLVPVYENLDKEELATKHCVILGKRSPSQEGNEQPLYRLVPQYPRNARRSRLEGHVVLDFTVTPEGRVSDVEVRGGENEDVFAEAAMEAVKEWRYKPRVVDGEPVPSRREFKITFELDNNERAPLGSRIWR